MYTFLVLTNHKYPANKTDKLKIIILFLVLTEIKV